MSNPQATRPQQPSLEAPHSNGNGHRSVRDLADGDAVSGAFAVRERELRQRRGGGDWLRLVLADRTGSMEAVAWDDVAKCFDAAAPGSVVLIRGRFAVHQRYGPKVTIEAIRPARESEYDPGKIVQGPAVVGGGLGADLRGVGAAAALFQGIDRDIAVTGALLHDIGKTEAYNDDLLAIELTDAGRLQGEIPLGYYTVRSEIERIDGFDPELAQAILHIILSHHGALENGSPVVPATREATLVHMLDNLGGRLGSFDRIERALREGETWSRFDPGIESAAYFRSHAA